jgi:hypothetical protein
MYSGEHNLNAKALRYGNLELATSVRWHVTIEFKQCLVGTHLQAPQLAERHHEKVSAATSRVKHCDSWELIKQGE